MLSHENHVLHDLPLEVLGGIHAKGSPDYGALVFRLTRLCGHLNPLYLYVPKDTTLNHLEDYGIESSAEIQVKMKCFINDTT